MTCSTPLGMKFILVFLTFISRINTTSACFKAGKNSIVSYFSKSVDPCQLTSDPSFYSRGGGGGLLFVHIKISPILLKIGEIFQKMGGIHLPRIDAGIHNVLHSDCKSIVVTLIVQLSMETVSVVFKLCKFSFFLKYPFFKIIYLLSPVKQK